MKLTKLDDLPRNSRYCILTEPLWAVFGTMALYYAALYMKSVGLDNVQIGIIVSANLYVAFMFQLVAGGVTNRLGRRRATFIFDLLSWTLPMFIWAVAGNMWLFLIGYLLNASSKIVNVSFNLLTSEDATETQRPRVFAVIKLIHLFAGLLTPVTGVFMAQFGTVPTLRVVHLLGGLSMLAHVLLRQWLTTETEAGRLAMATHKDTSIARSAVQSLRLLWTACRYQRLWPIVIIYVLTNLALQLNVFQVIYMVDVLKFGSLEVSWVPAVGAAAALVCYLGLMPRLNDRSLERNTLVSLVVSSLGWLTFLAIPERGTLALFLSTTLITAGPFLLESYRDTIILSSPTAHDRAALFSAVQVLTAIVTIPCGYISALIYDWRASLLFVIILACYVVSAALALALPSRTPSETAVDESPAPTL